MELITGALAALVATIWGLNYFSRKKRNLRKIPGPKGYPLVGNALQMDSSRPHEMLNAWAKQFGDLMRINLFGEDIVVVNSLEGITEVLLKKSNDFAGRPSNYRRDVVFDDDEIIFTDISPKWSYMKKASMTGLKQVGDQISDLEGILQGYLDQVINNLTKYEGKNVNVHDEVSSFIHQTTFTLVFGRELSEDEHKKFMKTTLDLSEALNPTSAYSSLDTLPFLRGFWYKAYREFIQIANVSRELYLWHSLITIEHHDEEIKCILDGLIQEMKHPTMDRMTHFTLGNISGSANNIIGAGTLTTSGALYYFISLMAAYPEIQDVAHDCVIKVIGHRSPSLTDRFTIPLVESMMLELLRLMSHVPVSVPHKTLTDTTLLGYEIPKGTQIWPNLWFLHHNEKLWEDPWEFKPKRFLDKSGDLVKADHPLRKQFYAFGAGRRVCVGETLAKHRMFLFIISMLQKFRFTEPEGEKIVTDPRELKLGFVLHPSDFNVCIQLRQ